MVADFEADEIKDKLDEAMDKAVQSLLECGQLAVSKLVRTLPNTHVMHHLFCGHIAAAGKICDVRHRDHATRSLLDGMAEGEQHGRGGCNCAGLPE